MPFASFITLILFILFSSSSCANSINNNTVSASHPTIRTIMMQNPQQPFELAAKLQWNPHNQAWDKVLVLYNGHTEPNAQHPVWNYLQKMQIPTRKAYKAGENLYYKAFHNYAYCTGTTPLNQGKPLQINFDRNQLGKYQNKDFSKDWNCPKWQTGQQWLSIVTGKQAHRGQGLQLRFPKGKSGCSQQCINWKPSLSGKFEQLYYAYWLKLPNNFDFVLGGKLPGIGSNKANTGGNKPNGRDGWSVRAMWNRQGQLGQYVYHMDQTRAFGEFMQWDMPPISKGKWHYIQTWVQLNHPQQANGIIQTWVDKKQVLNRNNIRFRTQSGLEIERFLFSSFFGGSGAEWAPKKDEFLYLDDFVIAPKKLF